MIEKLVKFADDGTDITLLSNSTITSENLPAGTYTFASHPMKGIWLTHCSSVPDVEMKIYGQTNYRVKKSMDAFKRRPGNTGILLAGEPGMGKSVFIKLIAAEAKKIGMPIIIIKQDHGPGMIDILAKIHTECLVIMDEFEKIFSGDDNAARNGDVSSQNKLLSLMDGIDSNKKLFIASVNDTWRVSKFMLNRPGRFFYHFEFKNLEQPEIVEYFNDRLIDKSKSTFLSTSLIGHKVNYDALAAIVEEVNNGYDIKETLKDLNLDRGSNVSYDARVYINGDVMTSTNVRLEQNNDHVETYFVGKIAGKPCSFYITYSLKNIKLRGKNAWDETLIIPKDDVGINENNLPYFNDEPMKIISISDMEFSPHFEKTGFYSIAGQLDI